MYAALAMYITCPPYMAGSAQMCVIGSMLESGLAWPGLRPRLDVDTVQLESCGLYESRSLHYGRMLAGRVRTCLANTRVGVRKMWLCMHFRGHSFSDRFLQSTDI